MDAMTRLDLHIGDARRFHTLTELALDRVFPNQAPPEGETEITYRVSAEDVSALHLGFLMVGREIRDAEEIVANELEGGAAPTSSQPSSVCPLEPVAREFAKIIDKHDPDADTRLDAIMHDVAPFTLAQSAAGAVLQLQAAMSAADDLHLIATGQRLNYEPDLAEKAEKRVRAALYSVQYVLERLGGIKAEEFGGGYAFAKYLNPHLSEEERKAAKSA